MTSVRVCSVIEQPAAKVFAALADWGAWDRWMPTMPDTALEPSGAPPGTVGAVRLCTCPTGRPCANAS